MAGQPAVNTPTVAGMSLVSSEASRRSGGSWSVESCGVSMAMVPPFARGDKRAGIEVSLTGSGHTRLYLRQ